MADKRKRTKEECMTLLGYGEDVMRIPFSEETKQNLRLIFNEVFMQEYTNCRSFDEFMFSSAVFINWDSSLLVYSKAQFDIFVSEATSFKTWDEMMKKGAECFGLSDEAAKK
jgi:hypothetical protein